MPKRGSKERAPAVKEQYDGGGSSTIAEKNNSKAKKKHKDRRDKRFRAEEGHRKQVDRTTEKQGKAASTSTNNSKKLSTRTTQGHDSLKEEMTEKWSKKVVRKANRQGRTTIGDSLDRRSGRSRATARSKRVREQVAVVHERHGEHARDAKAARQEIADGATPTPNDEGRTAEKWNGVGGNSIPSAEEHGNVDTGREGAVKTPVMSGHSRPEVTANSEQLGTYGESPVTVSELTDVASVVDMHRRASQVTLTVAPEARESTATADEELRKIKQEQDDLLKYVERNVIGNDTTFDGPYGMKRVIYCDYTASGRPVKFIEDYITEHVHPLYANTHTTTGLMARQTTQFRKEARQIIKSSVNAGPDDVLIFCGSGTTAAVNKLVSALRLKSEGGKNTVVFVGPYEHHSNILPWKETGASVERIKDTTTGQIDLNDLDRRLRKCKKKKKVKLIGCFSAASNVTGIITNTHEVAAKLHEHGALSFWDYAAAGPYLKIDMNPTSDDGKDCSKDAVYLSPHKFVGGVGTPGILLAKKHVFLNEVPDTIGGGTVVYVSRDSHHYSHNIEEREEGGTPAIVESIRAGLTFKLKDSIGTETIVEREAELARQAFRRWKRSKNLIILGSSKAHRLPIFSFLITHPPSGKILHHDFVAVILNDLFGIQARGGCACAGPYAHDLLGIDEGLAEKFIHFLVIEDDSESKMRRAMPKRWWKRKPKKEAQLTKSVEIMRPGFVRLNLPFFYSDEAIEYILTAVEVVAADGWYLLPQYKAEPFSAIWTPVQTETLIGDKLQKPTSDSLHTASFKGAEFHAPSSPFIQRGTTRKSFKEMLEDAKESIADAKQKKMFSSEAMVDEVGHVVKDDDLIWFLRPQEAATHIRRKKSAGGFQGEVGRGKDPRAGASRVPFRPKRYTLVRRRASNAVRRLSRTKREPTVKSKR